MSIELKQVVEQALDAFEAFGEADDFATLFTLTQKMNALRTAIQQADAKTDEAVAVRNPFASRCYTMSESHLSGHRLIVGFEKLEDAQSAHEWVARCGRSNPGELPGMWHESDLIGGETDCEPSRPPHPAPGVPDGYVLVPLQVLHDASDALGNFIMDHGWGDSDMQAMDNLDAYIAQHTAAQAQKGQQ